METQNMENLNLGRSELSIGTAIHILNDHCLMNIFMKLQVIDRIRIERVCKHWKTVSAKSWIDIKILNKSENIWGFKLEEKSSIEQSIIFKNVLQRCSIFLKCLNLSGLTIESGILDYIGKCPNLEVIDVGNLKLSCEAVKDMTSNCHNIREMSFNSFSETCNDRHLSELFSQNKKLMLLQMFNNSTITGISLLSLPKEFIKEIILHDCYKISPVHLSTAVNNFNNLRALLITFTNNFLESRIHHRIESLPKSLQVLVIRNFCTVNPDAIIALQCLQEMDISRIDVTDDFLVRLSKNCKELENVILDDCYRVTEVGFKAIRSLPKLTNWHLKNLQTIVAMSELSWHLSEDGVDDNQNCVLS